MATVSRANRLLRGALVLCLGLLGVMVGSLRHRVSVLEDRVGALESPPSARSGTFSTSYQQISNATLASAYTLTDIPAGATEAWIQPVGANLRWRNDDTAPTASTGNVVYAGDILVYDLAEGDIQMIREASGITVNVWFKRRKSD